MSKFNNVRLGCGHNCCCASVIQLHTADALCSM